MTLYTLDCDFDDPGGNAVTTGTLKFVASDTDGTVLKNTYITATPGDNVSIEGDAGGITYKVYLTPVGSNEQYVGEIIVVGNAALVTLLGN